MVTYNTVHRKILNRLARRIHDTDVLQDLFTFVNVEGGIGAYEVQMQYLQTTNNTKVTEEYTFQAAVATLLDLKRRQPLITTEIEVPRRAFEVAEGNEGRIGQLSVDEFSYDHQLKREELTTMNSITAGEYRGYNNEGLLKLRADATSAISLPASCESTAGTAETGGSWAGGQRGTMQPAVDTTIGKRSLALKKFYRRKPEENVTICIIHPIALQIIDDFPMYDGAAYLGINIRSYIEQKNTMKFYSLEAIDSDYVGAEDGTTQLAYCANPKDWFLIGVGKALSTEGFFENNPRTAYWARIHEGLTWIPIPLSDGTYYKKAVCQVQITPWNNAS